MKAVIQRVSEASVTIGDRVAGRIGKGDVILLGIAQEDGEKELAKLIRKIIGLRIFQDKQGKTNLSLKDVDGSILVISQFTLMADCRKGRRPSFVKAKDPVEAEALYEEFIRLCREEIPVVEHGEFGAEMQVSLINDGPFTVILDSNELN